MLKPRTILAAICAVSVLAIAGCGDDDAPEPSIAPGEAQALLSTLEEIEANLETDPPSCLVAADRIEGLQEEIDALPDSVDEDVKDSLQRGALNLGELVADPEQCEPRETTTTEEPTTTEETTTQETTTQETTTDQTTTQETEPTTPTTPTTPTEPPSSGGGIGPGGDGL
jgi:hypothetical protein